MKRYSSPCSKDSEYPAYDMQINQNAASRITPTLSEFNNRNQISDYPSVYSASGWSVNDSKFFDDAFIDKQ